MLFHHTVNQWISAILNLIPLVVFGGSVFNALLPPPLAGDDTTTSTNVFKRMAIKVRKTKGYTFLKKALSTCALNVRWAKDFCDPRQRDALQKFVTTLGAAWATLSAVNSATDVTNQIGPAADIDTSSLTDALGSVAPAAAVTTTAIFDPKISFSLTGPELK